MKLNNLTNFDKFRKQKTGSSLITEDVLIMDNIFRVRTSVDVNTTLINSFMKKVKDVSGEKIDDRYAKTEIAELIVNYITTNLLTVENLPVSIVVGTENVVQPVQTNQPEDVQNTQVQDTQVQNTQAQETQNTQAQDTAQEVPATEVQTQQGQAQNVQTQSTQNTQTQPPTQEI